MDISLWVNSQKQTDLLLFKNKEKQGETCRFHPPIVDTQNLLGGSKYLFLYLPLKSCRSHSDYFCILGELVLILIFHLCTERKEGRNRNSRAKTACLTVEINTAGWEKNRVSIIVIIWIVHYPLFLNWRLLIKLREAAYGVKMPSKEVKETRRESN